MAYRRVDVGISVSEPYGMAEAFKRLALERTASRDPSIKRRRVWAQNLYEEAVSELLGRLAQGEKVVFIAAPLKKKRRKTMWLDPVLWAQVRDVSACHDVSIATLVLTACLAYLEGRGITLE